MQCTAHRRDGDQCGSHAVRGATVCRMHGGAAPAVKAAAAARVAEAKAAKVAARLAQPISTDPAQALLDLVASAAGEVAYWRQRVDELQEQDEKRLTSGLTKVVETKTMDGTEIRRTVATTPAIEHRMWVDAQDRLARYATAALRAGVEERRVRVAEDLGAHLAGLIRRILDRLDLLEWQEELATIAVPEELQALGSQG